VCARVCTCVRVYVCACACVCASLYMHVKIFHINLTVLSSCCNMSVLQYVYFVNVCAVFM